MITIEYRVRITVEVEDMDLDEVEDMDLDEVFGAAMYLYEEALSNALDMDVSIEWDRVED